MATCDFNTTLTADYQNRTKHHLLTIQAQLLADILIQGGFVAAVDFNSVLARAHANGYDGRTQNKLEMLIAQHLCDISTGGGGAAGGGVVYGGNGDPNGVQVGSPPDIYVQYDSAGQQWSKTSGVGTAFGWE